MLKRKYKFEFSLADISSNRAMSGYELKVYFSIQLLEFIDSSIFLTAHAESLISIILPFSLIRECVR